MRRTNWLTGLLIGTTIISAGCGGTMPVKPTKPTLTAIESDGMICFSRDDVVSLGRYIIELERGYD